MKTIVISLARATERREKISASLAKIGASFSVLDATDGRDLTHIERSFVDDNARRAITEYPLTAGEIGCWHSHRRIMADVALNGPDIVAVLEDDAIPSPDFLRVLRALEISHVPFDFVDLHWIFRPSQRFISHSLLCDGYSLGWVRHTQMQTTGYVIRREGAAKFLRAVPRFSHAIDKSMKRWWANGMNYFVLDKPIILADREARSQIDDEGRALRGRYDNADALRWRVARFLSRASDTVMKRLQFRELLRRSRGALSR